MLIDAVTLAVKINRRGSACRKAASASRACQRVAGISRSREVHRLLGEAAAQLGDALEDDLRQRPERAGVEVGHARIEHHRRAGLRVVPTVSEARVHGRSLAPPLAAWRSPGAGRTPSPHGSNR